MNQLSISKKLALAFGILFLMFAGFGYFAVRSAENIGKEVRNIGDWMESRDRVAVISEAAAGLHRAVMYRITVDAPEAKQQWAKTEQERIATADDAFAEYEKTLNESEYDDPEDTDWEHKLLGEWAYEHFDLLPAEGDAFRYHDLEFTVTAMRQHRITELTVRLLPEEVPEGGEAE